MTFGPGFGEGFGPGFARSGPDTTPSQFTFVDQSGVELTTETTSAAITVSGINEAADITVTGGEYSINGGAFTALAGTVVNGDEVRARHTSSGDYSTATNTVVTIGGVADTFTSTTRVDPAAASYPVGGTACQSDGVVRTVFLEDAEAVPSTAVYHNGFMHTQEGYRYVCLWPASGRVFHEGAIARRGDGAMCIATSGTPADTERGFALTFRGEAIVSTSAPQLVNGALGMRQNGSLCVSEAA